jgi:glycosyltransferase involved in cell wall biosynthesis
MARLSRLRPDAVLVPAWGDTAALQLGIAVRDPGTVAIGHYGSTTWSRHHSGPIARLRRRHFRSIDAFVSYGSEATQTLLEDGVDAHRIVTGFNTVDVVQFARVAARHRTGSTVGRHRFLFVGQLVDRKAPHLPIVALASPDLQNAELTVVGAGPLRPSLERLARSVGVADRVTFRGLVAADAMPAVYAEHQTLVLCSLKEVWGLIANEALAAGLHVVLSNRAGCAADLAESPGVNIAAPDPSSITSAMLRSASSWTGPIEHPAILEIGPERLASDVMRAIEIARAG